MHAWMLGLQLFRRVLGEGRRKLPRLRLLRAGHAVGACLAHNEIPPPSQSSPAEPLRGWRPVRVVVSLGSTGGGLGKLAGSQRE